MPAMFSTDEVAQNERYSYWAEVICETFLRVSCRRKMHAPLHGQMSISTLGELEMVDVLSPAMEYNRGPAELARISGDGVFLLSLCLSGKGIISQYGKHASISPGDVMLWSTVAPSVIAYQEPMRKITVKIPYRQITQRIGCAEDALALALPGGAALGALVASLIRESHALTRIDPACTAQPQPLSRGMLDIVSFAFDPRRALVEGGSPRKNPLECIKRDLFEQMGNPELSFREVAARHHISLRTLNRLFAAEGTTAIRWLWTKRLDASRRLLESGQARQVSAAALGCGFNDLSHFCKVFKAAYGITPSQCLQHSPLRQTQ